jgi:hypothetical protein
MSCRLECVIPGILLAALTTTAQDLPKRPEIVLEEPLAAGVAVQRMIAPNVVHRYPLPEGDLFVHLLANQLSADVVLLITTPNLSVPAVMDATNMGWESFAVVLHGTLTSLP